MSTPAEAGSPGPLTPCPPHSLPVPLTPCPPRSLPVHPAHSLSAPLFSFRPARSRSIPLTPSPHTLPALICPARRYIALTVREVRSLHTFAKAFFTSVKSVVLVVEVSKQVAERKKKRAGAKARAKAVVASAVRRYLAARAMEKTKEGGGFVKRRVGAIEAMIRK